MGAFSCGKGGMPTLPRDVLVVFLMLSGVLTNFSFADNAPVSAPHGTTVLTRLEPKLSDEQEHNDSESTPSSNRLSSSITIEKAQDHRLARSLSRGNDLNEGSVEAPEEEVLIQKVQPSTTKAIYIIPYLRPGRSFQPLSMEDGYGSSLGNDDLDTETFSKRNGNSMIPMPRFGRGSSKNSPSPSKQNSMIPSMRFGRSEDSESSNIDEDGSRYKRRDTMIPMIRLGRTPKEEDTRNYKINEKNSGSPVKLLKIDPNFMLPYPRPGRSESELFVDYGDADVETGEGLVEVFGESSDRDHADSRDSAEYSELSSKTDDVVGFSGISDTESDDDFSKREVEDNGTIIPYPRMGRSNGGWGTQEKRQLIPQVRFGRAENKTPKPELFDFVLPYPRPGRSEKPKQNLSKIKSKFQLSPNSQYSVLPYPRPGRSDSSIEVQSDVIIENSKRQGYMTPVARLGRSSEDLDSEDLSLYHQMVTLYPMLSSWSQKYTPKELKEKFLKYGEAGSTFIIPYPRPGKRFVDSVLPEDETSNDWYSSEYWEDRNENASPDSLLQNSEYFFDDDFEIINDDDDENDEELKTLTKRDTKQLANGRILPYPRLGRSEKNSKNPIPKDKYFKMLAGNSDFVLPYPRPGRGSTSDLQNRNFMIPYARMGRNTDSNGNQYILPYPRSGRSNAENFMVPYPRPGRSTTESGSQNFMVPYPRPGRSKSITLSSKLPTKDKFILPYPRPGRSSSKQNLKLSKIDLLKQKTILPYPRPGRAKVDNYSKTLLNKLNKQFSILPYPRPGRSNQWSIPYPRPGRSNQWSIPYPRPGRSNQWSIPYPRPGRSNQWSIPYPRPGRSDQWPLLDISRFDRSESNSTGEEDVSTNQNTVIPYPRLGRSDSVDFYPGTGTIHKLDKHMLKSNSKYLLPYPRPGK